MASDRPAEGRYILVVEDEMIIVTMIEDTLSEIGADIVGPARTWMPRCGSPGRLGSTRRYSI